MTVQEIYKRFLIKVNKNDTNSNINVPKGVFVLIFNEITKSWLNDKIKDTRKNYQKNQISELLIVDKPLVVKNVNSNFTQFALPSDYFDTETTYSVAKRGDCTGRIIYNFDFKQRNKNVIFQNENEKPSFDYQETLYNINRDGIAVYTDGFEIQNQYLTYYKLPTPIDIEGYTKFDGTPSKNIDTDLDDKNVLDILNLCSLEAVTNFEDGETYQLQKQRTIN